MNTRTSRGRDDDDDDRGRSRGGSRGGFRYQARDPDAVKKRVERNTSGVDSYLTDACKIYKAPQGDNTLRILPAAWEDAEHYGIDVHIHYDVGSDGAAYLCLEKMKGKACPICEEALKAKRDGDQEYADKLRPNTRVLMYVIDREKEKEGVQVWSIGSRMDQDIGRLAIEKKTGDTLAVDHPETGYDFSFTREGQGMKTRYTGYQFARRPSPLDNDKALDFVQEHPLPDQLIFYSYDHISKVFSGAGSSKRDDDDDPPTRTSRGRTEEREKPKPKEVDVTWAEVHDMPFRKLTNLIEEYGLKANPDKTRDDEELADLICEELDIKKPAARRAARDDDDAPVTRRSRVEEEEPPARTSRSRVADDDETPTRAKLRSARDEG